MNCTEIREYLFAFLDNELDAHLSIELQHHLDHCPTCAQQAEIEREVRRQLGGVLANAQAVPAFDATVLAAALTDGRAEPGTVRFAGRHWRAAKFVGIAAAVAVIVILWTVTRDVGPPKPQAGSLADLMVQDYRHFVEQGETVQLASADAVEVSTWLREQTGLDVSLAAMTGQRCKLIGARKCTLAGQPAAFALYDMEGTAVSLVATDAAVADMGTMKRADSHGDEVWVDHCKGHTVVAKRQGTLVYAAVSTLPQNDLIHFIESVVHESD
ncbi:MAG: zf-HC2 domain-containing protein [Planctomycetes bacterium]|nr:zf-HC2 domain-containing protein [Planctomycetota bacterium]